MKKEIRKIKRSEVWLYRQKQRRANTWIAGISKEEKQSGGTKEILKNTTEENFSEIKLGFYSERTLFNWENWPREINTYV